MTGMSGQRFLTSPSSVSPSIPGMLMSDRITISAGSMPSDQLLQRVLARVGEVHGVGPLPHLAAKALPEQLGDIALVIDHQDADRHAAASGSLRLRRGRRMVNSV